MRLTEAERELFVSSIEPVAKALYEYQQGTVNGTLSSLGAVRRNCCPPWEHLHPMNRDWYLRSACAALSVIDQRITSPSPTPFVWCPDGCLLANSPPPPAED